MEFVWRDRIDGPNGDDNTADDVNYLAHGIISLNDEKVDKREGKDLSTNDYTDEDKVKLQNLANYDDTEIRTEIQSLNENKVNKVEGKQLSTEDYTAAEKAKLDGLVNYDDSEIKADLQSLEANKVNKVVGKDLSSEDYTAEEKEKLAGLSNYDDTEIQADIAALYQRCGVLPLVEGTSEGAATLNPNEVSTHTLTGDIDISLADGVNGLANEWQFYIYNDGDYSVTLPNIYWDFGIAPTFATGTCTFCILYYANNVLHGEWSQL